MSFINNLLLEAVKSQLVATCQTPYTTKDRTRANMVTIGRFNADPTQYGVVLSVIGGSETDPLLRDGRIGSEDQNTLGLRYPLGEVGGGHSWWRRGQVAIDCYLNGLAQEDARLKSYEVLGRVTHNLERTHVANIVDSYGELALIIELFASNFFESGGGTNYIWRGWVNFQVLTNRPF